MMSRPITVNNTRHISLRLPERTYTLLLKLGNGNISAGVRRLERIAYPEPVTMEDTE